MRHYPLKSDIIENKLRNQGKCWGNNKSPPLDNKLSNHNATMRQYDNPITS